MPGYWGPDDVKKVCPRRFRHAMVTVTQLKSYTLGYIQSSADTVTSVMDRVKAAAHQGYAGQVPDYDDINIEDLHSRSLDVPNVAAIHRPVIDLEAASIREAVVLACLPLLSVIPASFVTNKEIRLILDDSE